MHRNHARSVTSLLLFCLTVVLGVAIVTTRHNPLGWIDRTMLDAMVSHRTPALTGVVAGVTNLFGPMWVFVWTAVTVVAFIVFDKNVRRGAAVAATVAIAGFLGWTLKWIFNRPRPPFIDQATAYEAAHSFPSGHVTGTAALVFATALALTATSTRLRQNIALAVALAISVIAATTRLYLGVHWFSDVLAAIVLSLSVALVVAVSAPRAMDLIEARSPPPSRRYLASTAELDTVPPHRPKGSQHAAPP